MKKIYFIISIALLIGGYLVFPKFINPENFTIAALNKSTITDNVTLITTSTVNLSVPFIPEAPGTNYVEPWYNGCEEATIAMIEQFYLGKKTVSYKDAQKLMLKLFEYENKNGYQVDVNATETTKIINDFTTFHAIIKQNPTLEEIKTELHAGYPVIALLDSTLLYSQLYGNGYHMIVIKGYDDKKQSFITNDNGNKSWGFNKYYSYSTILKALRDFNHTTKKVDEPPTALFTRPGKPKNDI